MTDAPPIAGTFRLAAVFAKHSASRRKSGRARMRAFTLVEILAALLMMAIIIPVAMEGMSIATRSGVLGERKAAAMRVAEEVLNDLVVEGDVTRPSSSGTMVDGANTYNWTMSSDAWPSDQMVQLTVTVNFTVQGSEYSVNLSTLRTPTSADLDASGGGQ